MTTSAGFKMISAYQDDSSSCRGINGDQWHTIGALVKSAYFGHRLHLRCQVQILLVQIFMISLQYFAHKGFWTKIYAHNIFKATFSARLIKSVAAPEQHYLNTFLQKEKAPMHNVLR